MLLLLAHFGLLSSILSPGIPPLILQLHSIVSVLPSSELHFVDPTGVKIV